MTQQTRNREINKTLPMVFPDSAATFQVMTRDRDVNGNPYCLVLVYDTKAKIVFAVESRSSELPNFARLLDSYGMPQMLTLNLKRSCYNQVKKDIINYNKIKIHRMN